MNLIWTPWRMSFILGSKTVSCVFCNKAKASHDRENLVLFRGRDNMIIMNLYPYTNGHLMIIPYLHVASMEELPPSVLAETGVLIQRSICALRKALAPQGFNLGANIGKAAGAGIDEHFHIHVVPRWQGDSNFMPVLAETRMIPEMLGDTYERLIAAGIGAQECD
jgi:ATP adenylyltransferase